MVDGRLCSRIPLINPALCKTGNPLADQNRLSCYSALNFLQSRIAESGKGRVFVNNQPATVTVLRQLAPYLATIHAQNQSLVSFDAAARLELLDAFAAIQLETVGEDFSSWRNIVSRIQELEREEQDRLRLLDLWTFQKREIEEAKLQPGEDERLETEKRV